MFRYGLLEYSNNLKCFFCSVGDFEDDVYDVKLRDNKALVYTHMCHIFKLKSLNGMLKYKIKMFFLLLDLY